MTYYKSNASTVSKIGMKLENTIEWFILTWCIDAGQLVKQWIYVLKLLKDDLQNSTMGLVEGENYARLRFIGESSITSFVVL